jgi:hypothetical protein
VSQTLYEIVGIGLLEANGESGGDMVVYRQYGITGGILWIRPMDNFMEEVTGLVATNAPVTYRFVRVRP